MVMEEFNEWVFHRSLNWKRIKDTLEADIKYVQVDCKAAKSAMKMKNNTFSFS